MAETVMPFNEVRNKNQAPKPVKVRRPVCFVLYKCAIWFPQAAFLHTWSCQVEVIDAIIVSKALWSPG